MANEALRLIGSGPEAGLSGASQELNLRDVWRALRRRKLLLFATVVLITGAAFAFVSHQPRLYTAEALIHVQNRDAKVVHQIQDVVDQMPADPATMESEVKFLTSHGFLRRNIEKLNLIEDPEFNPALSKDKGPSFLETINPLQYVPKEWLAVLQRSRAEGPNAAAKIDPAALEMNRVIDQFASRLDVSQDGRSYVMTLGFTSEDPAKAADIANKMAEEYLVTQLETKYQAAQRATDWLSKKIDELRGQVLESEAKIVEYRTKNNLVDNTNQNNNPVTLQFFQLNSQLALAQAQRAEAEARLSQAKSLLNSHGGIDAAALVLTSPLMSSLREQETQLMRQLADMSTTFGENHPQMVNTRAEIKSIRSKMKDEVQRIVQDDVNEVAVAKAREQELSNNMAKLQSDAQKVDLAGVELKNLTRDADTNRELFQTFLTRFKEIVEQQGAQEADARILSAADVPVSPSYPKTKLFTLIAFAASFVLGVLLVFVVERWDSDYGFRSADEIQAALGVRALALVPDLSRRDTQGDPAEDYILQKPNSAYAEALQRIRTSLFLSDGGRPPKTILVTSSVPLEGKSTIAASLARQSARSGLRVILIDADLRRPRLHEVIGLPNTNGLSDVLTGRANPESAIKRDEKSGLDFLPAGVGVVSPPDLFRSSTMKILLEEMAAYYDLVIIDTPPVAAVSDGFTLSGIVDKSVYVIRWEQTPRNVALAGIRQMIDAGADIAGIVLARVDVKKHARYGYADSGYYHGYYRKYYVN
ncbi:MAG TPA: polysaccharide biosynthesis tyrosine autokinase [Geminicoccaceae bacterium]|jgi:succinoglycan biosynthesis transport protein ExoP|nr:polysaccharide biosynthesis tyrosine autokinase [Geminicoccaceae bacterium]